MPISRVLLVLGLLAIAAAVVFMVLPGRASVAWVMRYESLPHATAVGLAPLPGGAFAFAAHGETARDAGGNIVENPSAIVVTDARGAVKTSRRLQDDARFLATTSSGDLYVVERVIEGHDRTHHDRITKLHRDLSIAWSRRIETDRSEPLLITALAATADGGAVVASRIEAVSFVTKLSPAGAIEWSTGVNPSGKEEIVAIRQTRDKGFVAVGKSHERGWLVRLSVNGQLGWQRNYGPSYASELRSVVETTDGELICVGTYGKKPLLMKTDARGTPLWSKVGTVPGAGHSAAAMDDGVVAAWASEGTPRIMHLLFAAGDGSIRWQRAFRPGFAISPRPDVHALLSAAADGIAFTPILEPRLTAPVAVFKLDREGRAPGCGWYYDEQAGVENVTVRAETLAVESGFAKLREVREEMTLAAFSVTAARDVCIPSTPVRTATPVLDRPVKVSGFVEQPELPAITQRTRELFLAGEFAKLDAYAAELRTKKSPDPIRPYRELTWFYDVFTSDETTAEDDRLVLLRRWTQQQPASLTARVALAKALNSAAWTRRGPGYANTVTETAFAQFNEFMRESDKVLETAGSAAEADPIYWRLRASMANHFKRETVQDVGRRALTLHQDPMTALYAADYLHEKWGGSPKEYMAFAEEAARITRSTYGDAMYMWLVYQLDGQFGGTSEIAKFDIDIDRVWRGCDDLLRMAPDWVPSYHRCVRLAVRKENYKLANELLKRRQLEWYEGAEKMWGSRQMYDVTHEMILAGLEKEQRAAKEVQLPVTTAVNTAIPAKPRVSTPSLPPPPPLPPAADFIAQDRNKWPAMLLETEIKIADKQPLKAAGFLVETPSGISAVSSIRGFDADARFSDMQPRIASWMVWAPAEPMKRVRASSFAPMVADHQRAAIMTLPQARKLSVRVLKLVPYSDLRWSTVSVVGCRWDNGRCVQTVWPGRVVSANSAKGGGFRTLSIGFSERISTEALIGAAVLDERGYVVGVINDTPGNKAHGVTKIVNADDLRFLVK